VFVGPDTTVFRIAPSRSLTVLVEQLGVETDDDSSELSMPAGRQLLLSSDFYTVYQCLGRLDGVDHLWCWHTSAATSCVPGTPTPS
jgi:transposase